MKKWTEKEYPQGSDKWLELRENYSTASELPNVMGVGFQKRDEFLKNVALGTKPQFNAFVEQKMEEGHIAEAKARPLLEYTEGIGEIFEPCTGTLEDEGLLASFDGISKDGKTIWEHKLWNKTLPAKVKSGKIPPKYEWQLEQQLYVSGAEKAIFMCSDGTTENMVWCEYKPKRGRVKKMLEAWKEFHQDVRDYVGEPASPKEAKPAKEKEPEVVVERVKRENMPAIKFEMNGMELTSNLDAYIEAANKLVAKSEIKIESDDDFAECEKATKQLKKAEDYIKQVKADVLAEVTSIDEFNKALDTIAGSIRQARLNGENQVKNRKDEIRREIISDCQQKLDEYVSEVNDSLGEFNIAYPDCSFSSAIKGKKTIETLKQAAEAELEDAIDKACESGDRIRANVKVYAKHAEGYEALFPDIGNMITLEQVAFESMIKGRVADFKLEEIEKQKRREEQERAELEAAAQTQPEPEPEAKPDDWENASVITPSDTEWTQTEAKTAQEILEEMPITPPSEQSFADMEVEPVSPSQARQEHRYKIHVAIKETIKAYGASDELATTIVKAMSAGEIPRIQIDYSGG